MPRDYFKYADAERSGADHAPSIISGQPVILEQLAWSALMLTLRRPSRKRNRLTLLTCGPHFRRSSCPLPATPSPPGTDTYPYYSARLLDKSPLTFLTSARYSRACVRACGGLPRSYARDSLCQHPLPVYVVSLVHIDRSSFISLPEKYIRRNNIFDNEYHSQMLIDLSIEKKNNRFTTKLLE